MKNPLSEIYAQMLLTEAEKHALQNPSHDEVGSLKVKQELFGETPKAVEGPDKAKVQQGPKYEETIGSTSKPTAGKASSQPNSTPAKSPKTEKGKEMKDTDVNPKKENHEEDEEDEKKEKKKPMKNEAISLSSFEALFKKTIVEELNEEPTTSFETENAEEENISSGEESVDPMESEEDSDDTEEEGEEGDLISDLKELQTKLSDILSKLEDVSEESEDGDEEEYSDEDFDEEFGDEEEEEGNPFKESIDKPKALDSSKGKKLMAKKNKVGKLNPKRSKAHTGTLNCEPKPKTLGDRKAALQKGKSEVKSSIKKGDFIK